MISTIRLDPIRLWLDKVSLGKSKSAHTRESYERGMRQFLEYTRLTAEQILKDYPRSGNDRAFKQKYADLIFMWMTDLDRQGFTPCSIRVKVGCVQSFFKYHSLNLGMIQIPMHQVTYHNRDITKEEIAMTMKASRPRYRAFYSFMTQSGIRPHTICKLRLKHLEPDWSQGRIPCCVKVPQELAKGKYGAYFSFIGQETVDHLKGYFASRPKMNPESLLFCKTGHEDLECSPQTVSGEFNRVVRTLRRQGRLSFEVKEAGKPAEIHLYNLRKFFKKFSQQAGEEYNEFWMGHKGKGVIDSYRPVDVEFHRRLYKEKAMPFLRIEEKTTTEQESEIKELKRQLRDAQKLLYQLATAKWKASGPEGTQENVDEYVRLLDTIAKNAYPDTYETLEEREAKHRKQAEKEP